MSNTTVAPINTSWYHLKTLKINEFRCRPKEEKSLGYTLKYDESDTTVIPQQKLSNAYIKEHESPSTGDIQIPDHLIPNLYIRISKGSKTWIVKKRFAGKVKKWTIGHFPGVLIDEARKKAQEYLLKIVDGVDPQEEKARNIDAEIQAKTERELTVEKCVDFYLSEKKLADTTRKDIEQLKRKFEKRKFFKAAVVDIKKSDVLDEFKYHSNIGKTQANKMFRYLRSALEYSIAVHLEEQIVNPIRILSATKSWNESKAISRVVEGTDEQLKKFCQSIVEYRSKNKRGSDTIVDWLICNLLWGTRKTESISLMWKDVDFKNKVITLRETKNKLDHFIPICPGVEQILLKRYEKKVNDYVFNASVVDRKTRELTYIKEPKNAISFIREKSGIYFSPHDLRRTFANKLDDFGAEERLVKNALNHTISNDVTQKNYLRKKSVEKLRPYFEENENYWLDLFKKANVSVH